MSYSFEIVEATREQAKAAVDAKMSEIAEQQTVHSLDREPVCTAVAEFIDMLDDRVEGRVSVSVHGSLSWNETGAEGARMRIFTGANVGITVRKVQS